MANRDFEMDIKLRADFQAADRALQRTDENLKKIVQATQQANAEMEAIGSGRDPAPAAGGQQAAQTDALTASLARNADARRAVDQAARNSQRVIEGEIKAIAELQGRLERGAASIDDLADTEALLDRAMSKGLITAEEYDEALGKLNDEQKRLDAANAKTAQQLDATTGRYDKASAGLKRLERDEAQLKAAVDSGRISREQYNRAVAGIGNERARLTALREGANQSAGAMKLLALETAGAQRNLTQFLVYAGRGDFELAGNQILQMGTNAGLASRLFSVAGLGIGAAAGAVALMGAQAAIGYLQLRALDTAIIATGNSSGVTASELLRMRDQAAAASGAFADAQQAVVALAQSGRLSGQALGDAAAAAVNLADLTGRSIQDTTSEIIALAKSPTSALIELNERYHFLTAEVYANVASLEEQGRTQDATAVALEELARVSAARTEEMRAHAGSVETGWYEAKRAVGEFLNELKKIANPTIDIEIAEKTAKLRELQAGGFAPRFLIAGERARTEQTLRSQIAQLEVVKRQREEAARTKAEGQRIQDDGIRARAEIEKQLATGNKKLAQQLELNALTERYNKLYVANPNDPLLFDGSQDSARQAIIEKYRERTKGARKAGAGQKSDQDRAEEAAQRELDNLEKQVSLLGEVQEGQERASEAARINYEITEGAYKGASEATKQALVDQAQLLDSDRAQVEAKKELQRVLEEAKRSYEQLHDSLRTPAEAAVETAIQQVETLNAALEKGIINKKQLDADLGRVAGGIVEKSPDFNGLAPEIGGVDSEFGRLQQAAEEEQKWYQDSLARLAAFRLARADQTAVADAEEARVKAEHEANLKSLEQARQQLTLSAASTFFGNLAQLQRSENSKMAAIGKAAAITQALINTYQAATSAYASLASIPYVGPALGAAAAAAAIAAGLANVAQIRAQQTSYDVGGYTGAGGRLEPAGIVHRGEYVQPQYRMREPGAIAFMQAFHAQGMDSIYAWRGYADGGLVGEAMAGPNVSAPNWGEMNAGRLGNVQNRMRVYMGLDMDWLAGQIAQHPATEKKIVATAAENGRAIQAEW